MSQIESTVKVDAGYEVPTYHLEFVRDHSIPLKALNEKSAPELLHKLLDHSPVEQMVAIHLNHKNEMIGAEKIGLGSVDQVHATMGEIFRGALLAVAPVIILGHNHPHGDPTPSQQDWAFTHTAVQASELLNVKLFDHFVLSPDGRHTSMWHEAQMKVIRETYQRVPHSKRSRLIETFPLQYQEEARSLLDQVEYNPSYAYEDLIASFKNRQGMKF